MSSKAPPPLACVILAAGKGTRMKSDKPKVMHEIAGLPMIKWLISTVETLEPEKIIIVTSDEMQEVKQAARLHEISIQYEADGTGGAVKAALPHLKDFNGNVLILMGDAPLISVETLEDLISVKEFDTKSALSVLGIEMENPSGYGRLIADDDGNLDRIVEHKDANEEELECNICNTGAFCVDGSKLEKWLEKLEKNNAQGEYYLTDIVKIAKEDGYYTQICIIDDETEVMGVNNKADLARLEYYVQTLLRESAMVAGVRMIDPETVYFSYDTMLGQDVTVEPNVFFGEGVTIADNVTIKAFSHLEGVNINTGAVIGPFARLRPETEIGEGAKIGNFVEVKNAKIGDGAKTSHLSYIGDASIGDNSNIGAGTITCNYNGFEKSKTIIGKNVFVGSNSTLIAPITVENESYIAAGSVINKNVPDNSLAIARCKQIIHSEWAKKFRNKKISELK